MRSTLALAVTLALALAIPAPGSAQEIRFGGGLYGTHAPDLFDGASGAGALLFIDLPMLPVTVRAFGERYFPDCGDADGEELDGCGLWGYGAEATLSLPLPFLDPYLVGGLVYRFYDRGDSWEGDTRTGVAAGAGVGIPLGAVRIFAEGRWESVEFEGADVGLSEPFDQGWQYRAGLTFDLNVFN